VELSVEVWKIFSLAFHFFKITLNVVCVFRIFSLQNPPTPFKTQKKISKLLQLYLNEEQPNLSSSAELVSDEDIIYTLESLVPTKDTAEKSLPIFNIPEPQHLEIPSSSFKLIETWTPCLGTGTWFLYFYLELWYNFLHFF
jgi:hypothetical protein